MSSSQRQREARGTRQSATETQIRLRLCIHCEEYAVCFLIEVTDTLRDAECEHGEAVLAAEQAVGFHSFADGGLQVRIVERVSRGGLRQRLRRTWWGERKLVKG